MSFYSASQCIPWLVVLIIECLAIVILNIITIVVFVKKRQLQRRSTYLIIHLAIVDLLVGAVPGPLHIDYRITTFCNLWKYRRETIWSHYLTRGFVHLFSFTSLVNLIAIALERLHATFYPFRHRFLKKCVYGQVIIVIWSTSIIREGAQICLEAINHFEAVNSYLYLLFIAVSVFLVGVSYILIVIKVRCSRQPLFVFASKRERKFTGTALIVSLVSFLGFLPSLIFLTVVYLFSISFHNLHIEMAVMTMFLANSLVNPVVYALRMPGFRAGFLQILCRTPDFLNAQMILPLRNLGRA